VRIRHLEVEKVRKMENGARREVKSGSYCIRTQFQTLLLALKEGRRVAALGKILMLIRGGGTLWRNFYINIGTAARDTCNGAWNLGTKSAFAL
jgi:hypothetical protein